MSHPYYPYFRQMGECMCGIHQENGTGLMLNLYNEGIWWFCYAVRALCRHNLGPLVPLEEASLQINTKLSYLSYDETFLS